MNRRAFLGSLASLAAGMALDPERALWVPGRKTYFDIQAPPVLAFCEDAFEMSVRHGFIVEHTFRKFRLDVLSGTAKVGEMVRCKLPTRYLLTIPPAAPYTE